MSQEARENLAQAVRRKKAEAAARNGDRRSAGGVEPEELISCDKAAKILGGVRVQTLANWRSTKRGPRYVKVGRLVYCRRSDICDWLSDQVRDPAEAA
jgi:hypothetical protein